MQKLKWAEAAESLVAERLIALESDLLHLRQAREGETKSSAGDKYETGRAMMQQEMDKLESQKSEALAQLQAIRTLKGQSGPVVVPGSLVETSGGLFWLSVPLGKLEIPEGVCWCVTPQSPLGLALKGKQSGDRLLWQGKNWDILSIE